MFLIQEGFYKKLTEIFRSPEKELLAKKKLKTI